MLATALGSPAPFGQSQFAFMRGNAFEAKVKADGGAELLRLLYERLGGGAEAPAGDAATPDLSAAGPEGRAARTALALREATAAGGWALLDHPMLALEVAGSPAYLEPDAVVVHPDGRWTVVEIKSFPMIDASADPSKVGAAARQAAVYVLALERVAAVTEGAEVGHRVLLVCPKDFSNLPTASVVDVRKQRAVTRRQLTRLTRVEDIAAGLPDGTTFDPACPPEELDAAVAAVPPAYAPECLAACELAFHCRARSRAEGAVETLGRGVRGELGGLTTVAGVLAAAAGKEEIPPIRRSPRCAGPPPCAPRRWRVRSPCAPGHGKAPPCRAPGRRRVLPHVADHHPGPAGGCRHRPCPAPGDRPPPPSHRPAARAGAADDRG